MYVSIVISHTHAVAWLTSSRSVWKPAIAPRSARTLSRRNPSGARPREGLLDVGDHAITVSREM